MTYTITIPDWCPATVNTFLGRHWARKHRLRRAMTEMIGSYAWAQSVPKATGKRRVKLTVTGWASGGRLPDKDAFDKLLLDSLKQCWLIFDDSQEFLDGRVEVELRRGPRSTVIELEDVT